MTKQVGRPTRVSTAMSRTLPVSAPSEGHYSPAAAQLEPELTLGVEGQRRALQDLAAGHRGPQLGGAQAGSIAVVVFGTKRLHHLSFLFL